MTGEGARTLEQAVGSAQGGGANTVRVALFHGRPIDCAYSLGLPRDAFETAIGRAARAVPQLGKVREHEFKAYHVRDLECEVPHQPAQQQEAPGAFDHGPRVTRKRLVAFQELSGAPLLVLAYQRDRLPLNAFPCGAQLHDVRCTKQLRLALCSHPGATLVFESHVQGRGSTTAQPGAAVIRKVFVDIDLGKGNTVEGLQAEIERVVLGRAFATRTSEARV